MLKAGSEPYGNRVKCKVVKNKVAPPFKVAEFDILFGKGISKMSEMVDMGVETKVIEKSGSWFYYEGERLGQGKDNARAAIESNAELAAEIEAKIKAAMTANEDENLELPEDDEDLEIDLMGLDLDE